jgi:hypothetical protein
VAGETNKMMMMTMMRRKRRSSGRGLVVEADIAWVGG